MCCNLIELNTAKLAHAKFEIERSCTAGFAHTHMQPPGMHTAGRSRPIGCIDPTQVCKPSRVGKHPIPAVVWARRHTHIGF